MQNKNKMKIPIIFSKNKKQPWQWPSCKHPKTLSFRATPNKADRVFKTVNSVFIDMPESYRFTNSSSFNYASSTNTTTTTTTFSKENNNSSLEMVVRGVRQSDSERLFFEPGYTSSSIVKGEIMVSKSKELEATSNNIIINGGNTSTCNGSVAVVAMESDDPYLDFKKSMAEMVESHGLMKDWDCLEGLLRWYLRINSSNNHAFIVEAFLDLLVTNNSSSSSSPTAVYCSDSTLYSSADSCFSSAASSFSHVEEE